MICDPAEWMRHPGQKRLTDELVSSLAAVTTMESRGQALRRFRDREIFRADLRSILGLSRGQDEFSNELASVAEVLLGTAFELALREAASRHMVDDPRRMPPSILWPWASSAAVSWASRRTSR